MDPFINNLLFQTKRDKSFFFEHRRLQGELFKIMVGEKE